jgi:hypothetical protein
MNIKFQLKKAYKEYLFRYKYNRIKSSKESIYFFTFHKCASSLFSKHILKKTDYLQHVDYANYLADKDTSYSKPLDFKKHGCIYGPIRLSANNNIVEELLVKPATKSNFVKDINAIFLIRDPRDILVSSYHSFGFTHPINPIEGKTKKQLEIRSEIQSLSIDEYVLNNISKQIGDFNKVTSIVEKCPNHVVLKYEDMINNYDLFIDDFQKILDINEDIIKTLYDKTRPKDKIDNTSHRRSGAPRRFLKDLKPETIEKLNSALKPVLDKYGYEV